MELTDQIKSVDDIIPDLIWSRVNMEVLHPKLDYPSISEYLDALLKIALDRAGSAVPKSILPR